MVTTDERLLILETEFRTELKHLATKADLQSFEMRLMVRLGGLMSGLFVTGVGAVVAAMRL